MSATTLTPSTLDSAASSLTATRRMSRREDGPWPEEKDNDGVAVLTLVLWLTCGGVGVLGLVLPYPRPVAPVSSPEPVLLQSVQVDLPQEPVPPPDASTPPPSPLAPPPLAEAFTPPPAPLAVAVAQPSPAIAFALPVEGPTRIVEVSRAEYSRPAQTNTPTAPPVPSLPLPLVFGEGEGRQPAPDYPRQAVRLGQEGTVVVRLRVDEEGHVQAADVFAPSPWPLLNAAALRVVRERWRFVSGPARHYEVPIRFELTK